MYSGTTFRKNSGHFIGVHQKIDRVARRHLSHMHGAPVWFPTIKDILYFEGNNGPDGIKRKSPSVDEPWHYVDPTKSEDTALIDLILDHHHNLIKALSERDQYRAAFEAAWCSHAITDGLTPAHHYPLSEKIEELWGKPKEERLSIIDKNIIRGSSKRDTLSRNWQYWGAKGVFTTHLMFELGIATAIKTSRFSSAMPADEWLTDAHRKGIAQVVQESVRSVYELDMYHAFWQTGWSSRLARQSRQELLPIIIRTVLFAWYSAARQARP